MVLAVEVIDRHGRMCWKQRKSIAKNGAALVHFRVIVVMS